MDFITKNFIVKNLAGDHNGTYFNKQKDFAKKHPSFNNIEETYLIYDKTSLCCENILRFEDFESIHSTFSVTKHLLPELIESIEVFRPIKFFSINPMKIDQAIHSFEFLQERNKLVQGALTQINLPSCNIFIGINHVLLDFFKEKEQIDSRNINLESANFKSFLIELDIKEKQLNELFNNLLTIKKLYEIKTIQIFSYDATIKKLVIP